MEIIKNYHHGREYVSFVHEEVARHLREKGISLPFPKRRGLFRKRLVTQSMGVTIESTLRDHHDNTLSICLVDDIVSRQVEGEYQDIFDGFNFLPRI